MKIHKMRNRFSMILLASMLMFAPSFVMAVTFGSTTLPTPTSTPTAVGSFTPTPILSSTPLTTLMPTPIIIADSGDPARVSTGPGEAAVLALVMSLIASLLYVGYSYTPAYRRHEAKMYAKEGAREGKNIDFKS